MSSKSPVWYLASGLLAAVGATACCVLPLLLLLAGVTGTWISFITALEDYRPIFYVLVLFFFWQAGRSVFFRSACDDAACAKPDRARFNRFLYVAVALFVFTLLTSPWWLLLLVG